MTFSLRTLLLIVAVAAVGAAALIAQTRLWTSIVVGVGLAIVVSATIVAIYRRTLSVGIFCVVAWLYVVLVFSLLCPLLTRYLPTTILLTEVWYASNGDALAALEAQGNSTGVTFTKDEFFAETVATGYSLAITDDLGFAHFYVSGQMLFTLLMGLIGATLSKWLLKPKV